MYSRLLLKELKSDRRLPSIVQYMHIMICSSLRKQTTLSCWHLSAKTPAICLVT